MLYIPVESVRDEDGDYCDDYERVNTEGYNLTSNKVRCDRCGKIHDLPMNRESGFPNEEDVEEIEWVVCVTKYGSYTAHLCLDCALKCDKEGYIPDSLFGAPYDDGFFVDRKEVLKLKLHKKIREKNGVPEPRTGPVVISDGRLVNDKRGSLSESERPENDPIRGKDLIEFIQKNKAEDLVVLTTCQPGDYNTVPGPEVEKVDPEYVMLVWKPDGTAELVNKENLEEEMNRVPEEDKKDFLILNKYIEI